MVLKKKKVFLRVTIALLVLFTAAAVMAALMWYKIVKLNHPKGLKGADVSSYQGQTDWAVLSGKMDFVFVKATEGSAATDEMFLHNFTGAMDSGLYTGAYHFFSFDSSGHTQAQNFINTVPRESIDMPPVVDIEYYADKIYNKPTVDEAEEILLPLLDELEAYYGVKPVIYTTMPVYFRYVRKICGDYPLWIRSKQTEPEFADWTFWQYDDHGELEGCCGDEKYIDFNVYCGSEEDFAEYTKPKNG